MRLIPVLLYLFIATIGFLPIGLPAQDNGLFKQIYNESVEAVEATLKKNIDIEERNSSGDTAVLVAARIGRLEVLQLLIQYGANINVLDRERRDVLNIAISTQNPELAKIALALGADPTMITSTYDGGAIIYGSAEGAVEIVEMLIQAGAPVNRVNRIGFTALLEVAILGSGTKDYVRIAELLIAAGADTTIRDRNGKTALDHAKLRGHDELALIVE